MLVRNTFTTFVACIPRMNQYCFISTSHRLSRLGLAVTDGNGKAAHVLDYMPYGEDSALRQIPAPVAVQLLC